MLLAELALATTLALGTPGPAPTTPPTPSSHLPLTRPGSGPDEGVFLVTTADDGTRAAYFIAGNTRHSILTADMQTELRLNPLWPVHVVSPDQVLAFDEGAPIGQAPVDLLGSAGDEADAAPAEEAAAPEPAALSVVEAPDTDDAPVVADDEATADDGDAQAATTYTVKRGDSAFLIARQFGISQSDLLAANAITNPNRVYIGQVLLIPASS